MTDRRDHAWDIAIQSHGTAAMFEARALKIKWKLNALKVLGIVLPVLLGGALAAFGKQSSLLDPLLVVTGAVGILQLVGSAVALAMGWDDAYANLKESQRHNTRLADEYKGIAEKLTGATAKVKQSLESRIEILDVERTVREQLDLNFNASAAEKRLGLRAGLFQFQRRCVKCNAIPEPRSPSDCSVCGK